MFEYNTKEQGEVFFIEDDKYITKQNKRKEGSIEDGRVKEVGYYCNIMIKLIFILKKG